ncbi:Lipid-binding SYLF domain-containing protein [Burkholderia sp. YR290]|jgi:lipid-binding SYLF domain-containing protein|uniref:BPSL1445 family SYLF domain-containing lipoprotein n=1 Tax=Paraburkholderia hospita TaxID=169430 RepID=UPI0009A7404C|nr:YSC84-related protein [Paraburkholderia hospita]SKD03295.1 Lipid-binding SYLF domain-containing protein [Paraburkholderia hospita]SOE83229.1 Lipid-binding SYLF domain-containing protein [Burkholderia sp. YR290]
MQRRTFLWGVPGSMIAVSLSLSSCTTTPAGSDTMGDQKDKRRTIDAGVDSTLTRLYNVVPGARELVGKSNGLLVFPTVINAGIGLGGQYGEGALRVGGKSVGYYSTASASVGLQAGAQSKAIVFLFMTADALDRFRSSEGWSAGADASVAVLKVGANGNVDTGTATGQINAFVLTNGGLMAGATVDGTKVTRLKTL